jgi:lipase
MRLHRHEWGDSALPTMLCLHGVQAHGARFRRLAEERLTGRFHVVAPDLRGHGRSTWDPPWSLAAHVADIEELADELSPAVVLGHSFGGRLALELAARRPERVPRAILLDPAAQVPRAVAAAYAAQEAAREPFATRAAALEARLDDARRAPRRFLEEELDAHLTDELRFRYSTLAAATIFGELAGDPPAPPRCPTLLVVAETTDITTPEAVDRLRDTVDELTLVHVPGGHIVLWDAFTETADAIDAFLAATEP